MKQLFFRQFFFGATLAGLLMLSPTAWGADHVRQKPIIDMVNAFVKEMATFESFRYFGFPHAMNDKVYLSDQVLRDELSKGIPLKDFIEPRPQVKKIEVFALDKAPIPPGESEYWKRLLQFCKQMGWHSDVYFVALTLRYQENGKYYEDVQGLLVRQEQGKWKIFANFLLSGMHEEGG